MFVMTFAPVTVKKQKATDVETKLTAGIKQFSCTTTAGQIVPGASALSKAIIQSTTAEGSPL